MKERTRKHVRATLATVCALSLTASMAFPLVAAAQTGEQPTDLTAVDAAITEEDSQLPESEPGEKDTAESSGASESTPSAPVDPDVESGKTGMNTDKLAISSPDVEAAETADAVELVAEQALNKAIDEPIANDVGTTLPAVAPEKTVTEETAAEIPADQYINVFFHLSPPQEFKDIESNTAPYCSIPLGMSFQEAKQKGVLKEGSSAKSKDYFFNLGTANQIGIGDAHPEIQGYTFGGWMIPQEHTVVDATTPITQKGDGSYILTGSWKKDGSNVVSSTKALLGGLYVVAEGNLSGENAPVGADMRVVSNPQVVFIEKDFLTEAEKDLVDDDAFCLATVDLYVNGKQVHDKFGSLKLTFYNDKGFSEGATVRVWHQHLDGNVTHEDVKPVGDTVSITVTDLSKFLYAELTKDPNATQPGGDQKPDTDGKDDGQGNAGTQQPSGNDGSDDNSDKKDEDNSKNEGGKKTDDGKQAGSGDKGGNNKSVSSLAKTGDEMRYALGGTMAALTIALFSGGTALLMGNRKRPAHRRR